MILSIINGKPTHLIIPQAIIGAEKQLSQENPRAIMKDH
ncbi:hypothetical protein PL11201_330035 [Planktothrix sp. PCC 11201]|nr:hypothetical protein PL11201_330035 [Planktothrix sp. PCC 11201]